MTDHNEMLHQIADAIGKFLKKNGGMDNGYCTFINGIVRHNVRSGCLKFETPKTGDLTGNELREKANRLEDKICSLLKAYDYLGDIEIKSTHIEHGCFDINVSLSISVKIGSHHFNS